MDTKPLIKILFANMVNPTREVESIYPPLGPAYLVSYIDRYLGKNDIDFYLISSDFEKKILEVKPDIVGITSVSQNYNRTKKLAKFCKENQVHLVLIGGSHITLYSESLDRNIDIGVIGEGEETFLELMKVYIAKRKFEISDLKSINGLIFWNNGELQFTEPRKLIENLDQISFPDRTLFKVNPNKAYMFTSRGCPYRCVFCASSRFWAKTRFHSAEYVFNETKELVFKHKVKRIDFYDDLFIANRERVKKLVELFKKENLGGKFQIHVTGRANLIDDEICLLLKQMNVHGISLGLESGSPPILQYLKGGNVTVEQNFKAVETIKKHGMYCIGSFVIGAPIDTKETVLETLDFIKKSKLDEFTTYALTPLPGTPVWDYAVKEGLLPTNPEEINWDKIDVEYHRSYKYNVHLAKNLSRSELYKLYRLFGREGLKRKLKRALKLLLTDPNRFFYHIRKMIINFFKLLYTLPINTLNKPKT